MKTTKTIFSVFLLSLISITALAQQVEVCIKVRGNTGLEERLKNVISKQFELLENVGVTESKADCHLYVDLSLVEQDPIRFYGLGVSIAYHLRGDFYSRPTSDVAQFGEERMEDVCKFLVGEIDKTFLEPLKQPIE